MASKDFQTRIDKMVADGIKIPTPPAIAVRILNAVQKDSPSLKDLAEIISSDPALTAKLLQVANSSFYSLQYEVTSIEKTLTVLGVNALKNIALSFVIAKDMSSQEGSNFDFNYFWRRSITFAVAAELLAKQINHKSDDTFVTALLTDIGVLILHQTMPETYLKVLDKKKVSGEQIHDIETRNLGFNHAEMGAGILERWKLPESIWLPILFHHNPDQAPENHQTASQILEIAGQLSSIYIDSNSGERVRKAHEELKTHFDLSENQIIELVDAVASRSIEILGTFDIDPGDMKPYSQMLQEANEELGRLNLSYEQLIMELKEAKTEADRLAAEVRDANSKLHELVFRDGLTGLYNHRYFQEMVEKEIDRAERYQSTFSLIMFDIDHFKKVNDNYGHPSGDMVLMNIAHVVQNAVRPSDIVARYGGEEFAVILPETNEMGLKIFTERLRRSVEQMATLIDHKELNVTISVGGSWYSPADGKIEKRTIIDAADRALYKSKHAGRNCTTLLSVNSSTDTRPAL